MMYATDRFETIEELIRTNETRPINGVFSGHTQSSDDGDEGFTKTESYSKAVDLLRHGYEDPLEKIKNGIETASAGIAAKNASAKTDIVGYAPCVPNAILGLPNSMINRDTVARKEKIVSILYDNTGSACIDEETFLKSGIAVLTIVNSLESNGIRVSLSVLFFNALDDYDEERTIGAVKLKDWRQPLDLKKMAFPFCHPSMLRRIGFRWLERHPKLQKSWIESYGHPVSSRKKHEEIVKELTKNNFLKEHEKFISLYLCTENGYKIDEIMKACGLWEVK